MCHSHTSKKVHSFPGFKNSLTPYWMTINNWQLVIEAGAEMVNQMHQGSSFHNSQLSFLVRQCPLQAEQKFQQAEIQYNAAFVSHAVILLLEC